MEALHFSGICKCMGKEMIQSSCPFNQDCKNVL